MNPDWDGVMRSRARKPLEAYAGTPQYDVKISPWWLQCSRCRRSQQFDVSNAAEMERERKKFGWKYRNGKITCSVCSKRSRKRDRET